MYRCQKCDALVGPRKEAHFLYTYRERSHAPRFEVELDWDGHVTERILIDPGGQGQEIASQQMVCSSCCTPQQE